MLYCLAMFVCDCRMYESSIPWPFKPFPRSSKPQVQDQEL
jgi:hypothetical protein